MSWLKPREWKRGREGEQSWKASSYLSCILDLFAYEGFFFFCRRKQSFLTLNICNDSSVTVLLTRQSADTHKVDNVKTNKLGGGRMKKWEFVPLIGNLTCKLIYVTTKQLKVFLKYKLMGHKTQQFYFTLRLKLLENILNPFWTQLRSGRVSPPSDMIQPVTDTIVSLRRKWHEAHVIILNMSWTEGHRNKRARGELSRDNDKRDREERAMESPCKEEAERWSGRGRAGDDPFPPGASCKLY